MSDESRPPNYSAPAVEKALDVLEFLATAPGPASQSEIANKTGRSIAQLFRVMTVLERRGYIARDPQSGMYALTLRMYDLTHQQEPLRLLIESADGPMRHLASHIRQSCNLGVYEDGRVVIVSQANSPADFGFRVRVGASFPVSGNPSGELMLAYGESDSSSHLTAERRAQLREDAFAESADHLYPGVTDMASPILNQRGEAIAVLTVPYVATSYSSEHAESVRTELRATAGIISALVAGVTR